MAVVQIISDIFFGRYQVEQRWFSGHAHLKLSWIRHLNQNQKDDLLTYPPPVYLPYLPPYSATNFGREPAPPSGPSGTRISPAVLVIIVVLAVLVFISGFLHLLVRFLRKKPSSSSSSPSRFLEVSSPQALQRQLQQLFHIHDCGLDQAFIDILPVFKYKEIVGTKELFDCAVCLCEFTDKDKLRLLPLCGHAFHISCIDTWLLSNSTCPLCRGTLFTQGFSVENPVFYIGDPTEEDYFSCNDESYISTGKKVVEVEKAGMEKGVFPVRLGKFRKLDDQSDNAGGEASSSNLDARRCFSMGSYQYVVGDAILKVALKKDNHDMRLLRRTEHGGNHSGADDVDGKRISNGMKTDSYSVSKIWLWSKKGKFASTSDPETSSPPLDMELPWTVRTGNTCE